MHLIKNRLTNAEFASKHSVRKKLIAGLSIIAMTDMAVVVQSLEQSHDRRPTCLGQACGAVALQDPIESSTESLRIVKPEYVPRPRTPVRTEHPTPKPTKAPASQPLPSPSAQPSVRSVTKHPPNMLRRSGIAAHSFIERRSAPDAKNNADEQSYDWSYPQRHRSLPRSARLVRVGLNGGYPGIVNPYLDYQLGWAVSIAPHNTEIYVNTNNPGKYDSDLWPTSNKDVRGNKPKNPYGSCHGEDSPACSYLRGIDLAEVDEDKWLIPAAKKAGALISKIWLDAEGGPWQKGPDGQLSNLALLEGMARQFRADGYGTGIYAPPNPWHNIVGEQFTSNSTLYGSDEWLPTGMNSLDIAKAACSNTPFTGGHIVSTQYGTAFAGHTIDTNYLC